jgi:hypothetical protein
MHEAHPLDVLRFYVTDTGDQVNVGFPHGHKIRLDIDEAREEFSDLMSNYEDTRGDGSKLTREALLALMDRVRDLAFYSGYIRDN